MPATLSFEMMKMVYQFLAQTPSRLLMVQLEDLLGELDTPNLPGAADSAYPSWRVRLSRELTSWLKDPANAGFSQVVSRERRRRRVPALTRLTKK
jgi:4-alpha-glucanotransferase